MDPTATLIEANAAYQRGDIAAAHNMLDAYDAWRFSNGFEPQLAGMAGDEIARMLQRTILPWMTLSNGLGDDDNLSANEMFEHAARYLPEGWELRIWLEHDAGGVDLYDPETGDPVEYGEDDLSMARKVLAAVQYAVSRVIGVPE